MTYLPGVVNGGNIDVMSYLLTDPDVVLVVGGAADTREDVRAAIAAGSVTDVEPLESPSSLRETLAARDGVGCLVCLAVDPADVRAVCEAARTEPPDGRLPVVVLDATDGPVDTDSEDDTDDAAPESGPAAPDRSVAVAAADDEYCRYLPPGIDPARLRSVVQDCLDAYDRSRHEDARSSALQSLLAEGDLAVFVKDDQGRHVYRTDVEDGPDPEDAVGKTDVGLGMVTMTDADRRSYEDDLTVAETGVPIYQRELEYQFTGGDTHWTQATRIPWRGPDGEVRGVVGYAEDITRRKRYESLLEEQADRVDEVVNYISHDLRTPLQIVHGAVDVARRTDDDEEHLEKIADAADRIEGIVEDTRAIATGYRVSPLSSNTLQSLQADALTTGLPSLVEDVWSSVAPETATLDVELPEETVVTAEPEALRPILVNLFENAVEHGSTSPRSVSSHEDAVEHGSTSPRSVSSHEDAVEHGSTSPRSVSPHEDAVEDGSTSSASQARQNSVKHTSEGVTVTVGATDTNGLFVADDGPGIPAEERESVTDLGYTTDPDGTGTGLDIVSNVVDRQGWELRITDADPDATRDEAAAESPGARFEIEGPPIVTPTGVECEPGRRVDLDEHGDVGPVSVPGESHYDADTDEWTLVGDGRNVWGDTHEFHLVSGIAEPPVRIQGRIPRLDGVEEFSKAGFTVRGGRDERDPFGFVGVTETHGVEVLWRPTTDTHTASEQFDDLLDGFPWYRVEYVDGLVTCSLSKDGEHWVPVDQTAVELGDRVLVGLLVCSHSSKQTAEATFADVRAHELDVDST